MGFLSKDFLLPSVITGNRIYNERTLYYEIDQRLRMVFNFSAGLCASIADANSFQVKLSVSDKGIPTNPCASML